MVDQKKYQFQIRCKSTDSKENYQFTDSAAVMDSKTGGENHKWGPRLHSRSLTFSVLSFLTINVGCVYYRTTYTFTKKKRKRKSVLSYTTFIQDIFVLIIYVWILSEYYISLSQTRAREKSLYYLEDYDSIICENLSSCY